MKVVPYGPEWHERLLAFRQRVYPDNPWGHRDAHFRWRFLHNPLGDPPLYLLAVEGDTILGQWAGIVDRVWSGGRAWPVVWMVDLVVAPEHRDTMAAMALFRAAQATERSLLVVGAPAELLPFYQVFRWQRLAVADTFYGVLRPGPLLAMAGSLPAGPRKAAVAVADRVLPLALLGHAWAHRAGPAVEPCDLPGPEVDALFERLRDRLGVVPERSAALLDWKFGRRPCGRHLGLAVPAPGGALRAYAVLKLRERPGVARWAEVADFLCDPGDGEAFDALVRAARRSALAHDLDFLRLRCSLPEHSSRLRSPWWVRRVRVPIDDLFVYARGEARAALLRHPWTLTAASSDTVDTGLDEWGPTGAEPPVPP